jgi:hypothetical protein
MPAKMLQNASKMISKMPAKLLKMSEKHQLKDLKCQQNAKEGLINTRRNAPKNATKIRQKQCQKYNLKCL